MVTASIKKKSEPVAKEKVGAGARVKVTDDGRGLSGRG
jgi:hypothetical protein